jgi:NADH:ubiquinone oxidoreductase subunit 5 (subunit L)/multisubunit Na+/H+ antiporter MnhA subunit
MDINWLDANYLPWLIPVPPLLSFLIITLATGRYKRLSSVIAVGSVFISFIFGWAEFFHAAFGTENFGFTEEGFKLYGNGVDWMNLGPTVFRQGVAVDP